MSLITFLAKAVTDNGGEVLLSTPAKHLVWRTTEGGVPEVIGVEAEGSDGEILFRLRCINKDAQCIHVTGQPIPRLYAAGNNSGSPLAATAAPAEPAALP